MCQRAKCRISVTVKSCPLSVIAAVAVRSLQVYDSVRYSDGSLPSTATIAQEIGALPVPGRSCTIRMSEGGSKRRYLNGGLR